MGVAHTKISRLEYLHRQKNGEIKTLLPVGFFSLYTHLSFNQVTSEIHGSFKPESF